MIFLASAEGNSKAFDNAEDKASLIKGPEKPNARLPRDSKILAGQVF